MSFGGIAGLFLGFSLLSGAEIIYYFTIRACCMVNKGREELVQIQWENRRKPEPDYDLSLVPYFLKPPEINGSSKRIVEGYYGRNLLFDGSVSARTENRAIAYRLFAWKPFKNRRYLEYYGRYIKIYRDKNCSEINFLQLLSETFLDIFITNRSITLRLIWIRYYFVVVVSIPIISKIMADIRDKIYSKTYFEQLLYETFFYIVSNNRCIPLRQTFGSVISIRLFSRR